jgi:AraC family transcriptional regulator
MGQAGERYIRSVGGDLVSSTIVEAASMRIEVLRRKAPARIYWHFRQPELSLFWWSKGAKHFKATIDGHSVDRAFRQKPMLGIFPAGVEVQGEWSIGPTIEYTVVFLKPHFVKERLNVEITNSRVGFEHDDLAHSLAVLCREAASPDNMFGLLAEGWSIQALAHMARVSRNVSHTKETVRGGLTRRSIRLVEEYILEGRQPANLELEDLLQQFPIDWDRQLGSLTEG